MVAPSLFARISGILMIGVFGINVYIGLYDSNLRQFNTTHLYLNWLIAAIDLISAAALLAKPLSRSWIFLGGILWPVAYVISLALDIQTHLCLGGGSCTAFPTRTTAFDYLVLNDPSTGWVLWDHTIETAIALLFIVFVLSIVALAMLRKQTQVPKQDLPPSSNIGSAQSPGSP